MMAFRSFWPLYLAAHQDRRTRVAHYCATAIALSCVTVSIAIGSTWLVLFGIVAGYGIAIVSHRIDASRSMVLVNPAWGALADFKMCWLALTGRLDAELKRHVRQTAHSGQAAEAANSRKSSEVRAAT